jgi:hypothetical protein
MTRLPPGPIDPHAAVGGLIEIFEEALDLGLDLRILHGTSAG